MATRQVPDENIHRTDQVFPCDFFVSQQLGSQKHEEEVKGRGDIVLPDVDRRNNEEKVCFGTITDVRVVWLEDFELDRSFLTETRESGRNGPFKVLSRRHYFHLQSLDGVDFAIINTQTHTRTLPGKAGGVPACINIYGPFDVQAEVGKQLSTAGIYLQRPARFDSRFEYDNPQSLRIPTWVKPGPILDDSPAPISELENAAEEITGVLDSLDQSGSLKEVDIDGRISTKLLSHQKLAVDFMTRKESGFTSEKFSLWKLQLDGGRNVYRNAVTGSKRFERPVEPLGGIIADDMGLGKTLAVLSQVIGAQDTSTAFGMMTGPQWSAGGTEDSLPAVKGTLVVVPLSLLNYWVEEIDKHAIRRTLVVHKYHGPNRETKVETISQYDLVLTTYHTLAMEFIRGNSLLQQVRWFRIVLDEAHMIRHHSTKQFKAAALLSGLNRWCLTGTPIQNKLEDIGSLLQFLKVHPLDSPSTFRSFITDPLRMGNAQGLQNLRSALDTLCLRRTRDVLPLPDIVEQVVQLELSEIESEIYNGIRAEAKRIIDNAINTSSANGVFFVTLQSILRCRLLCTHGTLLQSLSPEASPDPFSEPSESFNVLQQLGQTSCAYCGTQVDSLQDDEGGMSGILKSCSHFVCQDCDTNGAKCSNSRKRGRGSDSCSFCTLKTESDPESSSLDVTMTDSPCLTPPASLDGRTTPHRFSTKISKLVEDLGKTGSSSKSIVFSCWRKTLNLVENELKNQHIRNVRMDGTVSGRDRQKVIESFNNPDVPVLLMTTGTGSVGLSLPMANHVFIMEPQWNPAVEKQAIGRVLRMGQTRPVTVTRYIMSGTIEESVRSRQSKKLQVAELTWKSENPELHTLKTLMDLRALF